MSAPVELLPLDFRRRTAAEMAVELLCANISDRLDAAQIARVWAPQEGPQTQLVSSDVPDIFFGGARGGGKTDGIIGDWLEHERRWGAHARGLLIRRTYPELEEVQSRCTELLPQLGWHYWRTSRTWVSPRGARLKMRYLKRDADADNYQGHSYTWLAIDELGSFPRPDPIDKLQATLRSAHGVACVFRATGNPGGIGHNWIKARYVDPAPWGTAFESVTLNPVTGAELRVRRLFIPSKLDDNRILMAKDPHYWERVEKAAGGKEWLLKAWRYGVWDITAGGMFDDLWRSRPTKPGERCHVLRPFPIPASWRIDRAFDWGSSKPFSYGLWAESDGDTATDDGRIFPRGTLFRIAEWYGCTGEPDHGLKLEAFTVGEGIAKIEKDYHDRFKWEIHPGPADPSIFTRDGGPSKADDLARAGVTFAPANTLPGKGDTKGIRQTGWDRLRDHLRAVTEGSDRAGLYVFDTCTHFLRTVPGLARDARIPDDVDTEQEDHIADETRYRVMGARRETGEVEVEFY